MGNRNSWSVSAQVRLSVCLILCWVHRHQYSSIILWRCKPCFKLCKKSLQKRRINGIRSSKVINIAVYQISGSIQKGFVGCVQVLFWKATKFYNRASTAASSATESQSCPIFSRISCKSRRHDSESLLGDDCCGPAYRDQAKVSTFQQKRKLQLSQPSGCN